MATPALKAKELGNKAYKAKQFDAAIKHYDEAIALDPTDITFYNNKGGMSLLLSSHCVDFWVFIWILCFLSYKYFDKDMLIDS